MTWFNRSIRGQIFLSAAAILSIFALAIFVEFTLLNKQLGTVKLVSGDLRAMRADSVALRRWLVWGDDKGAYAMLAGNKGEFEAYLRNYRDAMQHVHSSIDRLEREPLEPGERAVLAEFRSWLSGYERLNELAFAAHAAGRSAEARMIYLSDPTTPGETIGNELWERIEHRGDAAFASILDGAQTTEIVTAIAGALAIFLGFVISAAVGRSISNRMRTVIHSMETAVGEELGALVTAMQRLAGGDLQARVHMNARPIEVRGHDEAAQLGLAYNKLLAGIENAEIEFVTTAELLSAMLEQLKSSADVKMKFVATISHEIRTPLNGIVGVNELLGKTKLDERQRKYVETIDASAEALLRLVNEVLDFSKVESDQMQIERSRFDLTQTVEGVAVRFAGEAQRKGLALEVAVDPALAGSWYGDPVRLSQVLDNLVGNALKFTRAGTIAVRVSEALEQGRRHVRFTIADTGIGIPPREQARIFQPFIQAEGSGTNRSGGTGLGLAIVSKLVDLMGGEITVESRPGEGSTFTVTLPLERYVEAETVALSPPPNAAVLVVSDDPEFADLVSHQLAAWGITRLSVDCAHAPGALAAAARARASRETLAVVDVSSAAHATVVDAVCDDPRLDAVRFVFVGVPAERVASRLSPWRRRSIAAPVMPSPLYDALTQLATQRAVVESSEHLAFGRARPERLLVAEDNEVNRMLAIAQLRELGFTVDSVEDGADAVVSAKTGRYALILMDSQMPVMDGLAATREIRAGEAPGERIPIIAMTAGTAHDYRERCLAAGMDDYIAKPVLLGPLRAALDKWLPAGSRSGESIRA